MSILGTIGTAVAGGLVGAGAFGEQYVSKLKEDAKLELANKLASERDLASDSRRHANSLELARVQSGLKGDEKQREIEIETSPDNVDRRVKAANTLSEGTLENRLTEWIAKAGVESKVKVEEHKQIAKDAAELQKTLGSDKGYLSALNNLNNADPAKRASAAASLQQTALLKIQTDHASKVEMQRNVLANAEKIGDAEAAKSAKASLQALQYDNTTERAQRTADAAVIKTLESTIGTLEARKAAAMTPAEQARIQKEIDHTSAQARAMTENYFKESGITVKAAEKPEPSAENIEALRSKKNDAAAVSAFNQQYGPGAAERVLGASTKAKATGEVKEETATDRYLKALDELKELKKSNSLLSTPKGNLPLIKAKEEEVNRLLEETRK